MSYYVPLSHFFVGVVNTTGIGTFSPKRLDDFARGCGVIHAVDPHLLWHTLPLFVFISSNPLSTYITITIFVLYRLKRYLLAQRVVQEYISYSPLLLGCSLLDQKR